VVFTEWRFGRRRAFVGKASALRASIWAFLNPQHICRRQRRFCGQPFRYVPAKGPSYLHPIDFIPIARDIQESTGGQESWTKARDVRHCKRGSGGLEDHHLGTWTQEQHLRNRRSREITWRPGDERCGLLCSHRMFAAVYAIGPPGSVLDLLWRVRYDRGARPFDRNANFWSRVVGAKRRS